MKKMHVNFAKIDRRTTSREIRSSMKFTPTTVEIVKDTHWRYETVAPMTTRLVRTINSPGTTRHVDAYGCTWICARITLAAGQISYRVGEDQAVIPWPTFGLIAPKYSLLEMELVDAAFVGDGQVSSVERILPCSEAVAFPLAHDSPADADSLLFACQDASERLFVSREKDPSGLAKAIKSAIDRTHLESTSLLDLAYEIGIGRSSLTQHFRRAYGIAPIKYRNHMRVVHSALAMLNGEPVLDAALAAGFGDTGRFYKNFNAIAETTPGSYALSSQR